MINKLQLRFMYLTVRFMAKFMMYGAEGMRNTNDIGMMRFTEELINLGDELGEKIK